MNRADRARSHVDRSRARAWAVQVLYQWEMTGSGTPREALADTMRRRRIAPGRVPYLRALVETYGTSATTIDEQLRGALKNWRLERLAALDRAILRVGATELLAMEDVPGNAAIHEAVLLAERYGGPDSPPFVNGVLEALRRLAPEGSLRAP